MIFVSDLILDLANVHMTDVDVSSGSAVEQGILREKKIVDRRLEKYRERLEGFEKEYGMGSEEFMDRFESGELGDDSEWFDWKFAYEAVQRLEEKSQELEKAVPE